VEKSGQKATGVSCGTTDRGRGVPEARRRGKGRSSRSSRAIPPDWRENREPLDRVSAQLDEDLRFVLRRLIEQLGRPPPDPGDRPLVLEVELEGLRCLFMLEPSVRAESTLSPREQQIARMVAQGFPNKTIAAKLGISSWTVSTHLRRMFAKFDVRSRAALIARLLEEELVLDDRRLFPR
jgi:DNA-binding CsgD family transcriptional regulator